MSDTSEYWNDVKEYFREKQNRYETKISGVYGDLVSHPECREVGDHYRLSGIWDFWHTGTVRNIKTGENIDIKKLHKMYKNKEVRIRGCKHGDGPCAECGI